MIDALCEDLGAKAGDRLLVMINGVGSTTLMEQYLVLNGVKKALDAKGIGLARAIAGEFLTVQEMGGFQMFAAKMDDELLALWDAPCNTPALVVK